MNDIQRAESTLEHYGVDFEERELKINRSMDFEQWDEFGVYLARLKSSCEWWTIDWILYGLDRFGEAAPSARAFATEIEREGWQLAPKTVQNYISIGRKFPPERRIADLPPGHYETVCVLPAARQDALLEQAERENLNVQEFRKVARRFKQHIPKSPTDPHTVSDRLEQTIEENYALYSALRQLIAEVEEKTGLSAAQMMAEDERDEQNEKAPDWPALVAAWGLVEDIPGYGSDE